MKQHENENVRIRTKTHSGGQGLEFVVILSINFIPTTAELLLAKTLIYFRCIVFTLNRALRRAMPFV
jgi:hypothetical protein